MVKALTKELSIRKTYLLGEKIETIYFGGGTPSILLIQEINQIIDCIQEQFDVAQDAEITLEANPDDINLTYLQSLKAAGINRLSIGIQSFFDEELEFMNRSHNAQQARKCIDESLSLFTDISIDLIFSGQYSLANNWNENLKIALDLGIPHLSCYSLTIEDKTVFASWVEKNKLLALDDNLQKEQFTETVETLTASGYEHYEISNYAKDGKYAKHNTNYWKGKSYLGIGPSAHSFDGVSRQWNVANNHQYLESIANDLSFTTSEELTPQDKYNEYILTTLRTMWGCNKSRIKSFEETYYHHFVETSEHLIKAGKLVMKGDDYVLTLNGKLFADQVAEELFYLS